MESFTSNINNLLGLDELQVRVHTTNSTLLWVLKREQARDSSKFKHKKKPEVKKCFRIEPANKNIDKWSMCYTALQWKFALDL